METKQVHKTECMPFNQAGQGIYDLMVNGLVGPAALPEGFVISQGLRPDGKTLGIDNRKDFWRWVRHKIQGRQLATKGVLDSTAAIVHTTVDEEIIDTTRIQCPLQELIAQETARGKVASYDILSARGSAVCLPEDTGAQTPPSDTYLTANKTVKIFTSWGGWTDFGLVAMGSQYPSRNASALEIRNKTQSLNELYENELINGSTPNGTTSYGMVGLRAEIWRSQTANALNYNMNGGDVTDEDIENAIADGRKLNVNYNLAITDGRTWNKIKAMMMAQVEYVNPVEEIAWGLKALAWQTPAGNMPIVVSNFMNYNSGSREILLLDTKFLAQRLLLDSTMEMMAKVSIQQNFVIKKFVTVIDKTQAYELTYNNNNWPATTTGTSKMARIYGIA